MSDLSFYILLYIHVFIIHTYDIIPHTMNTAPSCHIMLSPHTDFSMSHGKCSFHPSCHPQKPINLSLYCCFAYYFPPVMMVSPYDPLNIIIPSLSLVDIHTHFISVRGLNIRYTHPVIHTLYMYMDMYTSIFISNSSMV